MLDLFPFPGSPEELTRGLGVTAAVQRERDVLQISWALSGELATVVVSAESEPVRSDALWRSTCFEAFFAVRGEEGYWEVNVAPSRRWNVYRLDGYRRGLRLEDRIEALIVDAARGATAVRAAARLDLGTLGAIGASGAFEASLTAVVETAAGTSYWARCHAGAGPDFHLRSSFVIEV